MAYFSWRKETCVVMIEESVAEVVEGVMTWWEGGAVSASAIQVLRHLPDLLAHYTIRLLYKKRYSTIICCPSPEQPPISRNVNPTSFPFDMHSIIFKIGSRIGMQTTKKRALVQWSSKRYASTRPSSVHLSLLSLKVPILAHLLVPQSNPKA
jgi:hypothetical protein